MIGTYIYTYEDSDDRLQHLEVEYETEHCGPGSITILLVCDTHGNELTESEWQSIVSAADLTRAIKRFEVG